MDNTNNETQVFDDKQLALFEALSVEARRTTFKMSARQLGRVIRSVINYPFADTEKFASQDEKVLFKTIVALIQTKQELSRQLKELDVRNGVPEEVKSELKEYNE